MSDRPEPVRPATGRHQRSLAVERALDLIADYLRVVADADYRAALIERIKQVMAPFEARLEAKGKKAEQAKPSGNALVWKDRGAIALSGGAHRFEAQAAQGTYQITPGNGFGSRFFVGYAVVHRPTRRAASGRDRVLSLDEKALERAKAIAQADHNEGNDARS